MAKNLLVLLLVVAILAPGCALRAPVHAAASSGARLFPGKAPRASQVQDPAERAAIMRKYAQQLQVGGRVKVRFLSGGSFTGTLMAVTETHVMVKPSTRIPEPIRSVPFSELEMLEPHQPNAVAKIVAIAAGVAVATLMTFGLIIASISD